MSLFSEVLLLFLRLKELCPYGEGGTDFRPAFEYVDSLIEKGEYVNLKGLIYFTDGYGIYPNKMPSYRTAFVFLEEDYRDADVPPWAVRLVISGDSLKREL